MKFRSSMLAISLVILGTVSCSTFIAAHAALEDHNTSAPTWGINLKQLVNPCYRDAIRFKAESHLSITSKAESDFRITGMRNYTFTVPSPEIMPKMVSDCQKAQSVVVVQDHNTSFYSIKKSDLVLADDATLDCGNVSPSLSDPQVAANSFHACLVEFAELHDNLAKVGVFLPPISLSVPVILPCVHRSSPAALALVRPIFVPWIRCNKYLNASLNDYNARRYGEPFLVDSSRAQAYCFQASSIINDWAKYNNPLINEPFVPDLSMLFQDKTQWSAEFHSLSLCYVDKTGPNAECLRHMDSWGTNWAESLPYVKVTDPYATKFWYALEHTACERR